MPQFKTTPIGRPLRPFLLAILLLLPTACGTAQSTSEPRYFPPLTAYSLPFRSKEADELDQLARAYGFKDAHALPACPAVGALPAQCSALLTQSNDDYTLRAQLRALGDK